MAGILLAVGFVWVLIVPAFATHVGWATAWPTELPGTFELRGHTYSADAGTGCLQRGQTPLKAHRAKQIGSIPVVFGSGLPVLVRTGPPLPELTVTVQSSSTCYVVYGMHGGP